MCLLAITASDFGQITVIAFAMCLAIVQLVFPAKARYLYLISKELRGIVVDPSSPALSNGMLRVFALIALLMLSFVAMMLVSPGRVH